MIDKYSKFFSSEFGQLSTKAFLAIINKSLGILSTFFFNVYFTRVLGPKLIGRYFLIFAFISILSTIGKLGYDRTLLRFVSKYRELNSVASLLYFRHVSLKSVVGFTVFISMATFVFADFIAGNLFNDFTLGSDIRSFSIVILPLSLHQNFCEYLKGLGLIQIGLFLQSSVVSIVSVIGLFICTIFIESVSELTAIFSYSIAVIITLMIGFGLIENQLRKLTANIQEIDPIDKKTLGAELWANSKSVIWSTTFQQFILWLPTLLIGYYKSDTDVAEYEISRRCATLLSFFLMGFNAVFAPKISALVTRNEIQRVATLAKKVTLLIVVVTLPLAVLLFGYPELVLDLFGRSFSQSSVTIRIMIIGQLINVIAGPVGVILMMSGNEDSMKNSFFISFGFLASLSFLLIPTYGYIGGAIASSSALAIQNVAASLYLFRKLNIVTFPAFYVKR
ncbi:MAG: oligosaccharide flippase family protein [Imperialibacter sp.]|uniref:lipopolysaccharide biosynthesis protein n=1 Tax=Imperialibacter sp. TaxID=2038411 RepID=UPI0032EE7955